MHDTIATKKATADLPDVQLLPGMDVGTQSYHEQNTHTHMGLRMALLLIHKLHEIIAFFILGNLSKGECSIKTPETGWIYI